jgi:predicted alpha/beta-hydrolase family hydrolase
MIDWVRTELGGVVVLAGRSMGGRMGTMLAAEGERVHAVVSYAYPLHPAGKPDRLRIEHLGRISVPLLFFQGTRDSLATAELFDTHIRTLRNATVVDLEGIDHSWRGGGNSPVSVAAEAATTTARWIGGLATSS